MVLSVCLSVRQSVTILPSEIRETENSYNVYIYMVEKVFHATG